ncbi:MAG: YbjN domain-containing protein [Pseudomonadota bacterium]|nr:YbjN domain-containing protein [Pseudomonadota bacterium]
MKLVRGAIAAAALCLAPMANADAKPPLSKAEIADVLSSSGYAVQDFQSNMLAVVVGEQVILVGVDGADGDVSYITYLNGVSINQIGHEFLSKFNSEVKFGRAYVDRDGDVALQMDRNSAGGVSLKNIESDFDVFLLLISKFLSDLEARASA